MTPGSIAVVGAAETTEMGRIPGLSTIGLHADAALNAISDSGLGLSDIDGIACAGVNPHELSHYLGLNPAYADGTSVGGCSFMLHVRHAAAAIDSGLCKTVLITHGESGRSRVGVPPYVRPASGLIGQFEVPFGASWPAETFTIPALRYLKTYGIGIEALALVATIQREWAGLNPRAYARDPITVDDVFASPLIAWPFHKLMCCLVTDGGGALILTSAERARDMRAPPVYIIGAGEGFEATMISQMADFTSSRAFRMSGQAAFAQAGISRDDVDHLMIYDAFAHLPLFGLEDLGFCGRGEAGDFIAERNTAIGGRLPMNTNGGGLSYMHSGMYGMYALQESVRQIRGVAPAQVPDARISVCHGVGGMFAAAGTIIFSNDV